MEEKNKNTIEMLSPQLPKIISICVCVLITLILFVVIIVFNSEYTKAKGNIDLKENQFKNLEKDVKSLNTFLARYKKDIGRFEEILFADRDIPLFLENISRASKEFQIRIVAIRALNLKMVENDDNPASTRQQRVSNEKKEEDMLYLASTPFNITIIGKFRDIVNFLLSIEKYRQLLSLSNVEVKVDSYPALKCSFRLDLYSLKTLEAIKRRK